MRRRRVELSKKLDRMAWAVFCLVLLLFAFHTVNKSLKDTSSEGRKNIEEIKGYLGF